VKSERLSWRTLGFLAIGAVAVRIAYLAAFARHYKPQSDAQHYQTIAKYVADGDGIAAVFPLTYLHPTAFRPPLYPALLGSFYWITGVHVGAGQLLNVALGAALVVLAALLGAHIAGRVGGFAAGIAVAVYPPILANDVVILSESLSLALLLLMIVLLVRNRPAWAGLACGLLVLTRPSAQLLGVGLAAWLVWRAGWRAAVRFGVVTIVVVAPWIVRNWVLLGSPTVVSSNGFHVVATYSAEAQHTYGFANAIYDDRFTRINLDNRSEVDLDTAFRTHALDAIRDNRALPLRVVRHNLSSYFELRPGANESAERSDGRNITLRNVTLPLFYVATAAGLVGLWRARFRRGAELLLLEAAYFTVVSVAVTTAPRLRVPLDVAAAIGVGVLFASVLQRRVREPAARAHDPDAAQVSNRPPGTGARWSRGTRILVVSVVTIALIAAAGGVAFARDRVEDNARSQLRRTIDRDGPAVQRLAEISADDLVGEAAAPPPSTDFNQAQTLVDRLWLLSPRLSPGLRIETRHAARALDEAITELKVLGLVTSGRGEPSSPPASLDAARATYEGEIRPANSRLPDWDTISANTAMRRATRDVERLERPLRP
jgi:hypothetical protein